MENGITYGNQMMENQSYILPVKSVVAYSNGRERIAILCAG